MNSGGKGFSVGGFTGSNDSGERNATRAAFP
jgi:hypothetical protein